jgi:hypothetical protein
MIDGEPNFHDARHALMAGVLLGLLTQAGIQATAETDDEGDYMNLITVVTLEFGRIQISVLP